MAQKQWSGQPTTIEDTRPSEKFQIVRRNVINGRVTTCQCDEYSLCEEYKDLVVLSRIRGFRSLTFDNTYEPEYGQCEVTVMPLGRVSFEED